MNEIMLISKYVFEFFSDEYMVYSMYIFDLNPGTTYQIRVVAKNGINLESPSEWQEFTTEGVGKSRF